MRMHPDGQNSSEALSAYRSQPAVLLGDETSYNQLQAWNAACKDEDLAKLPAADQLDYAWMRVETAGNDHAPQEVKEQALDQALTSALRITALPEVDPFDKSGAYTLLGSLVFWRLELGVGKKEESVARIADRIVRQQKAACAELHQPLKKAILTPEQEMFCRILGVSTLINTLQVPQKLDYLAADYPPRVWPGGPDGPAYHLYVGDLTEGATRLTVVTANGSPEGVSLHLPADEISTDAYPNEQGTDILRALTEILAGEPRNPDRTVFLNRVRSALAKRVGAAFGTTKIPRLVPLTLLPERPVQQKREPVKPKPAEIIPPPPFSLSEATGTKNLLQAYRESAGAGELTAAEAERLQTLARPLYDTAAKNLLDAKDLAALADLSIDCAAALANVKNSPSEQILNQITTLLEKNAEHFFRQGDTGRAFEAFILQRLMPFHRAAIMDEPLSNADLAAACKNVAEALFEAKYERVDAKSLDDVMAARLGDLQPYVLFPLIINSQTNGQYLALPSLPRQRGASDTSFDFLLFHATDKGYKTKPPIPIRGVEGTKFDIVNGVAHMPARALQLNTQANDKLAELLADQLDPQRAHTKVVPNKKAKTNKITDTVKATKDVIRKYNRSM